MFVSAGRQLMFFRYFLWVDSSEVLIFEMVLLFLVFVSELLNNLLELMCNYH